MPPQRRSRRKHFPFTRVGYHETDYPTRDGVGDLPLRSNSVTLDIVAIGSDSWYDHLQNQKRVASRGGGLL